MSPMLKESDLAELSEGLRRCRPETLAAAVKFRMERDLSAVPQVVFGILERYQPAGSTIKISDAGEDVRLIEDIGLDSLTLLEIVMTIEEVLKVRIENDELRNIRTLGQLNQFLRAKITGEAFESRGRRYQRADITLILAQQPPFLFLDSAEVERELVIGHYRVKGDEFFLEGHFKNEPVFPASIVFEALGQAACLWLLEEGHSQMEKKIESNQIYFASMDGAHFFRKTLPGDELKFEVKALRVRDPLAVFEGTVSSKAGKVAQIERLTLAFGEQSLPEKNATEADPATVVSPIYHPVPATPHALQNGHH